MAKCLYCSTEASDPKKGPSLWKRAVVDREQVLICPDCQRDHPEWIERAEVCPECASKRLYKALGDVICKECGNQW